MTLSSLPARLAAMLPRTPRRRIALGWAMGVLFLAAVTAPAVGISRDESVYFEAAEGYARFWVDILRAPSQAVPLADRAFSVNREHPGLAKEVFGFTHAVLSSGLGLTSHAEGFRFGTFLFAALLAALLSVWGHSLCGAWGGVLAPGFFFLVPRHFYHCHPAVLDLPETAVWFATAYGFWRSVGSGGDRPRSGRWAVGTGLFFGASLAVKHNGWFLLPLLFACWLLSALPAAFREGPRALSARFPVALLAMGILGPLILLAAWPWLWHDPVSRLRAYFVFHLGHENYPWMYFGTLLRAPPFPVGYPFVVTALTVPAAILVAMAGGLSQSLGRIARALRGGEGVSLPTEVLLSANALFPIALISWPTVPHFGGVKHWMPAMPFLALLAARAVVSAGQILWPRRPGLVIGVLAALAFAPAAWQVAHTHPFGTAAWNELAGGPSGAASLGMQRQFWGDNMVGVLPALNDHAAPGARVWFQEATWLAVREYQRDERLRADLAWANGPEDADISVWHYHREFLDKEFRTWTEFGTTRPVAGAYLDEVPLVQVYARPGAWR